MFKRLFCLMVIGVLLLTVDGLGQNTWVKTYGGSRSEQGLSINITKDGGNVLTGYSFSNDGDFNGMNKSQHPIIFSDDIVVMKTNDSGDIEWKKYFGGIGSDWGYSIQQNNDSGYVLTGFTLSNDGDFSGMNKGGSDIFVMKLNSTGNIVWKNTFGGSDYEGGQSIISTDDGGCILTGDTKSNDGDFSGMNKGDWDIVIIKLDSYGVSEWKKTIGGSRYEQGLSIKNTNDGGYILTGTTNSNDGDFSGMNKGGSDIFVMKLDSTGNIVWKNTFGGSYDDEGRSIISTNDSGYVLTGMTNSNDGDFSEMNKGSRDIFVLKLNLDGELLWERNYGGINSEYGTTITTTHNGGYVLTGRTNSNDGDFSGMNKGKDDVFVLKLNSSGDIVWKKTLGGSSQERGVSINSFIDGGYVLIGNTNSNDGDFSVMNKGEYDIFVIKLDSNGNLNNTTSINEFSEPTTTLSVHPNPFNNSTTVSYKVETPSNVRIELLNTLGQTIEVLREVYTDIGTYQLPINVSTLSSGLYSVRMRSGSMNEVVPVWVVR